MFMPSFTILFFVISYIGDKQKELVQKNESNLRAETCLFLGVVCFFISVTILLSLIVDHEYLAILEYFYNLLF